MLVPMLDHNQPTLGDFTRGKIDPPIEFFTVCTKLAEMAIFLFKGFNNSKKKLPPVGLDLMLQIITGLGVQCLTR